MKQRRSLPIRVAHDLRAQLSQILIWGEIARMRAEPEIRERALAEIRRAALAQSDLIDQYVKRRAPRTTR